MPPTACRCNLGCEAGVDHKTALCTNRSPDEVVHRHRPVMRVAADEMIGSPSVALGVANGIDLVFVHGGLAFCRQGERSEGKDCGRSAGVQAWTGFQEFES